MDNYQAVYDAVRSRFTNCDIGSTVESVLARTFDISHLLPIIVQDFQGAASEMQRPSVLFRPSLYVDGSAWCALYGRDIMVGVAGFGDSPNAAMRAFDGEWVVALTATAKAHPEAAK